MLPSQSSTTIEKEKKKQYCMINIRIADVIHAGNRKHKSKIFNFEIENGFFFFKENCFPQGPER